MAVLTVNILKDGVHSGDASGVVPESFRIIRQLLDRLENTVTGDVHQDFHVDIPPERYQQTYNMVKNVSKESLLEKFPFLPNMRPADENILNAWLGRTWKPTLTITGVDGVPPTSIGGNVMRPFTAIKLSIRLPPTLDT